MPKATEWQSLDLNPRLTSYYMLEERPLLLGVRGDEHLVNKGGKAAEIAGMADTPGSSLSQRAALEGGGDMLEVSK